MRGEGVGKGERGRERNGESSFHSLAFFTWQMNFHLLLAFPRSRAGSNRKKCASEVESGRVTPDIMPFFPGKRKEEGGDTQKPYSTAATAKSN